MPATLRSIGRWLARGANLRVVVATMVALALFGLVVDIASRGDLLGSLGDVVVRVGPAAILLSVPYFALRAQTWRLLLDQVGVRAPMRQAVAAFSAGELSKSLPGGVYLEAYVLARIGRLREREIVGAAVATTGMDVMVGTVSFLTAMAIGLPDRGWFRLLLVSLAAAWIVIFGLVWLVVHGWRPHARPGAPAWQRTLGRILEEAVAGAGRLVRPASVRPLATTATYLALSVGILWLVLVAVSLGAIGLVAAVSVVAVTSLANDLLPIPTELGLTEITGVGVLGAYGMPATDAAIVMLGYRVAATGALTLVVLAVMAVLRTSFATR